LSYIGPAQSKSARTQKQVILPSLEALRQGFCARLFSITTHPRPCAPLP